MYSLPDHTSKRRTFGNTAGIPFRRGRKYYQNSACIMFIDSSTKVFFVLGVTDMRKGIDSLSLIVSSHNKNTIDGSLYVFCSRNRKMIKVLFWDKNGFALYQKRLESDKFIWPNDCRETIEISISQLRWLLDGLNPLTTRGHKKISYESII